MNDTRYDVTIIGGGPAGLFTAFYAGMRDMKVNIVEALPHLGGQLSAVYPEKYIYDVGGIPKIKAQHLVDQLTDQMMQFAPDIALSETAKGIERDADGFVIQTDKAEHRSKAVIITGGIGAFEPRKLKLDEATQYENGNLHYFVKDVSQFEDRDVLICGGGDSAVDWALMLEPIAKSVTLIHRNDRFRAHEQSVTKLHESSVKVMTPYVPAGLEGDNGNIDQVTIANPKDPEDVQTVKIDDMIVNYGFVSSLGPLKDWGLNIEKNSIVVNGKYETNIEGVYAVGDINSYDGKINLIATGFGEAPVAINEIKMNIDPGARRQPMHSTTLFEQKAKQS
ncbi:NAD(P)/FAD-dependent oxidoreductase [Tuberibacillus sp. Marseille-P3662]|uniref:NAD(P)/FAD-dependent oxidoreductase n=1 Tax=Tuberibacillus sp. Marseille-P3662 TaxID=1965358 RepID=UPI000A1C8F56|nr:NAD(P)/FAD-dependent oxidoreductase [Tuberibacillus sp. Marseille-P3662]